MKTLLRKSRNGGIMARIEGKISFPERHDPRIREASPGERWEIEITGSNLKRTVNFFRLLKSPTEIKREEKEAQQAEKEKYELRRAEILKETKKAWERLLPDLKSFLEEHKEFSLGISSEIKNLPKVLKNFNPEAIEVKVKTLKEKVLKAKKTRELWDSRTLSPNPGNPPVKYPRLEDFDIPFLTTWIKWTTSWEGDGMRPGDNTRSSTYWKKVEVLDPSSWEAPVRTYFQACAEYAGLSEIEVNKDIEALKKILENNTSEQLINASKSNPMRVLDVVELDIIPWQDCPKKAIDLYHKRLEEYNKANRAYLLSRTEEQGGIIRIIDNVPCAPVVRAYSEEPTIEMVTLGNNGIWDCPYANIIDWKTIERWDSQY